MEDLLASIRKAIQDDVGEVPGAASARVDGSAFRGTMRELRVRAGEEINPAAGEIEELRSRIQRTRESEPAPLRTIAPPPRTAGFAEILAGDIPRPGLRPGFAESDFRQHEPEPPHYIRREALSRHDAEEASTAHYGGQRTDDGMRYLPQAEARPRPDPAMLSPEAAAAANTAFNRLAENILNRASGDRSMEDMTREMLRGMLKQWLDDNLPTLVERLVREEIERVARRGR